MVKDADYAGKQQTFSKEECICIYEKTSKKYTIINADTTSDDLKNALKDMGCTDIEQNVIHENLIEKLELNELKKAIVPNYFVSDMAELRGISYKFDDQCKAAVFLRPTEDGGFSFAIIGADRTREELEKLLTDKKNFGLSDKAAAKIIHECCFGQDPELQRIIAEKDRPESKHISNTPLTIIPLTSKSAMISDGKKEIITETEKINSEFLIKAFAVNPKLAENAAKAIAKGFKREERADGRKPFAEVLGNITKREKQKKTERAVERTNTLMDEKGKASETVSLSKSIVR